MSGYSQNNEETIVAHCFGNHVGNVLDIGANDGKTLSNSLALIEKGWGGVLVEPSSKAFERLKALHKGRKNVHCIQAAIGTKNGMCDFHESGEHLKVGDHALLSTLKASEREKWEKSGEKFVLTRTKVMTAASLLSKVPIKKFDFITIDVEGFDYEVLIQLDLNALGCRVLCVETNSIEDAKYITYAEGFGMRLLHKNFMNLIFTR